MPASKKQQEKKAIQDKKIMFLYNIYVEIYPKMKCYEKIAKKFKIEPNTVCKIVLLKSINYGRWI
jgi:hypothetical protein